jgi:hypothetical protein
VKKKRNSIHSFRHWQHTENKNSCIGGGAELVFYSIEQVASVAYLVAVEENQNKGSDSVPICTSDRIKKTRVMEIKTQLFSTTCKLVF